MAQFSDPIPSVRLQGKHLYFIGIGGCGMSGLARIVQSHGSHCRGSDCQASVLTESLERDGIAVTLDQTSPLPPECDGVVVSAAISSDHPQLKMAQERNLPVLKYAQLLGQLMIGRVGVAIAGTHGKSTTTSMLSYLAIQAGLDPSLIVGATCQQIGGGSRVGKSDLLIAEACEYDRSFHNFHPTMAAILNVEEDHLDVYENLDAIVESFATFASLLPETGYLLIGHDMPHRLAIAAAASCPIQTVGFSPQADWHIRIDPTVEQPACDSIKKQKYNKHNSMKEAGDVSCGIGGVAGTGETEEVGEVREEISEVGVGGDSGGDSRGGFGDIFGDASGDASGGGEWVRLIHRDEQVATWHNPLPGEHMAYNAAVAVILAIKLGASAREASAAISCFAGLDRRMQVLGRWPTASGDVQWVDDYGHHPTEIDTTLRALRRHYRPRRLICVFQPHQHSRTRFLLDQFARSFSEADLVIVPEIYFVRDSEKERQAVSASDLVERIRQLGKEAIHLHPFGAIVEKLQRMARDGDLIVTMGAGDVWRIGDQFRNASNRKDKTDKPFLETH